MLSIAITKIANHALKVKLCQYQIESVCYQFGISLGLNGVKLAVTSAICNNTSFNCCLNQQEFTFNYYI